MNGWLYYYAIDEIENIHSNEFKKYTIPQIYNMNMSDIRNFYRKLGQMAYFNFDGNNYIVSHGGIPYIPNEDGGLLTIATNQLIKGVGTYNDNIDEIFATNYKNKNTIQAHAHRNIFEIDDSEGLSYNLEGKVEFGGNLKVLQLSKGKKPQMIKIQNNVYKIMDDQEEDKKNIVAAIID